MTILDIQNKLANDEFEISLHAFEEAVDDFLSLNDVTDAITLNGEIIEERVEDFRCLVLCKTHQQYVHVVFDYFEIANLISTKMEIVTIYKPDPAYWIHYRKRRK